jgi:hypothetical protein
VRAGSLADLKAKGQLVLHGRHPPILAIYDGERVSRSTIAARIWAFPSIAAASRTAFSLVIGITRASIWRAAAPSIFGPMTSRPARSRCVMERSGSLVLKLSLTAEP